MGHVTALKDWSERGWWYFLLSRIGHKETGETSYGSERLARKKLMGHVTAIKDWSERSWWNFFLF
jgi:hypothetical protein